jgi:hypothetical protein
VVVADSDQNREPPEVVTARANERRLAIELDRMLAAVRAGMDPMLAAGETRKIQAELAQAHALIAEWASSQDKVQPVTEVEARRALEGASGLVDLLATADRKDRIDLYRALGLQLQYMKEAATGLERIHARLQLCGSGGLSTAREN